MDVDPLGLADIFFAFKNLNDANLHSKRTHRQLFICLIIYLFIFIYIYIYLFILYDFCIVDNMFCSHVYML